MKNLKIWVILTLVTATTGCYDLVKNYEFDTDPDALKSRTMLDYFGNPNSSDLSRTIYCEAVRRAGLEDVIAAGNVTCVVPNNTAWNAFLTSIGVSSIDEVEPIVLKSILQYLIFPGEYRALTMTQDENNRIIALSGDPIWISRTPSTTDQYRMMINNNPEALSSVPVVVRQQDYMFKDNVVAQVVNSMVTYQPIITPIDEKPEGVDDSMSKKDTLFITDDTHVYIASAEAGNVLDGQGVWLVGRSGVYRVGLFKLQLKDIDFLDDLVSAIFTVRVRGVATYRADATCRIDLHTLADVSWRETTATYNSMIGGRVYPLAASFYLTNAIFTVPGTSGVPAQSVFYENPLYVKWDITRHMIESYENAGSNVSGTQIAFAVYDNSPGMTDAGTIIYLCAKDFSNATVAPFLSYIALAGPFPSTMRLRHNNPVTPLDGAAVLTPDATFAMEGPAVDDGYDYSDNNVIYLLKVKPSRGVITKYGIPITRNDKFTQAEMTAGVIKYLKTGTGQDSFVLSVSDYLGGLYYPDENTSTITVNIN